MEWAEYPHAIFLLCAFLIHFFLNTFCVSSFLFIYFWGGNSCSHAGKGRAQLPALRLHQLLSSLLLGLGLGTNTSSVCSSS